jgi:hypothetical protein
MLRLVPLPITIFLGSLLLPPELSIEIGSLRLSGYRIVLLVMFLPCLYQLLNNPATKISVADYLMLFTTVWCLVALLFNHGFIYMVETGGILAVEMLGAYLLARVYICSLDDFVAAAKLFVLLICALLIFAIPETITGKHYLRGPIEFFYPKRLGLHRVYGPFDHPILFGVFCALGLSYAYYIFADGAINNIKKFGIILLVVIATFLSVSAGPLIALFAQIGLICWEKITRSIPGRWWITAGGLVVVYIVLDIASNRSPIALAISYASFSGQTAYFRLLIFDYGSIEVMNNFMLGIGFHDWTRPSWMPSSVDNFWLLTAMRYGMPCLISMIAAILYLVIKTAKRKSDSLAMKNAAKAWAVGLAGLMIVGCTVTFWNSLFVLFFYTLGSGCWFLESQNRPSSRTAELTSTVDNTTLPSSATGRKTLF